MLYLLPFPKVFGSVSYNYNVRNNFNLRVNVQHVVKIIFFLKYHTNCLYEQLIDISSIDYINKKFRFELFYNIRSIRYNNRIFLTCLLYEADTVATVTNIYPNANWYEREIWDMFGIYFKFHPDLRRILTDYGFKGHPLRKDFPMTGYLEARYDAFLKRILYEIVSLAQTYRIFSVTSTWVK